MKKQFRKLSLLGLALLISAVVLMPITQADSGRKNSKAHVNNSPVTRPSSPTSLATHSFANPTPIRVPGTGTSGVASPYPSVITVAGVDDPITSFTVKLVNLSHTFPDDMDVLLVSPSGTKLILMSDAGGGTDLVNNTITIDDAASGLMPDGNPLGTGTYRPTNYGVGDTIATVATPYQSPAAVGAATFSSAFGSENPNGNWQLFIVDDTSGDSGIANGGWELVLMTEGAGTPPCALSCPASVTVSASPDSCSAVVNYPNATVEGGCGTVTYSHPSGSTFPLGTTAVTVTATQADSSTKTCSFNVTVTDDQAPTLETIVGTSLLEHPFNHTLENVGLTSTVSDNCSAAGSVQVSVFSNEDDEAGSDDESFSPDAKEIALGTLRLRKERLGSGGGRVYLIITRASDAAGSTGYSCNTVVVPLSNAAGHQAAVNAKAAAALSYCQNNGAAPNGYVAVGDGPTSGSKQ